MNVSVGYPLEIHYQSIRITLPDDYGALYACPYNVVPNDSFALLIQAERLLSFYQLTGLSFLPVLHYGVLQVKSSWNQGTEGP